MKNFIKWFVWVIIVLSSISVYIVFNIGILFMPENFGNLADWISALSTLCAVFVSLWLSDKSKRITENKDENKLKKDGYYNIFQQLSDLKEEISLYSIEYNYWKMNEDAKIDKHMNDLFLGYNMNDVDINDTFINSRNVHSFLSKWETNWQLKILAENILEVDYILEYKDKYTVMIDKLSDIIESVKDKNYEVDPDKIKPILDLEEVVLKSYKKFNDNKLSV